MHTKLNYSTYYTRSSLLVGDMPTNDFLMKYQNFVSNVFCMFCKYNIMTYFDTISK